MCNSYACEAEAGSHTSPGTHGKGTACPCHTMSCWPQGEWRARCTTEQGAIANSSKPVMLQPLMSREYFLTGVTLIKTESCLLPRAESRTRAGEKQGGSDEDQNCPLTCKIGINGGNMKCPNIFPEMSGEQWFRANIVPLLTQLFSSGAKVTS